MTGTKCTIAIILIAVSASFASPAAAIVMTSHADRVLPPSLVCPPSGKPVFSSSWWMITTPRKTTLTVEIYKSGYWKTGKWYRGTARSGCLSPADMKKVRAQIAKTTFKTFAIQCRCRAKPTMTFHVHAAGKGAVTYDTPCASTPDRSVYALTNLVARLTYQRPGRRQPTVILEGEGC